MVGDIDFTIYLEEYKKLFTDFFSSNAYPVKLTKAFGIIVDIPKELMSAKLTSPKFTIN